MPIYGGGIGSYGSAPASFALNINSDAWWANSTRTYMAFSNAHQEVTTERQLEFAFAQHGRVAGDHTGVRYAAFSASGAPTLDYYWPEDDILIEETDNAPTWYLPSAGVVANMGVGCCKIIDITGTPSAVRRNLDGSAVTDFFDVIYLGATTPNTDYWGGNNYNPACLVNPDTTHDVTCYWGGAYGSDDFGNPPTIKIVDRNPNYPATSSKRYRMRVNEIGGGVAAPLNNRYMVKIGAYAYWGGGKVRDDTANRTDEFYRIYVPDLINGTFTQESITDGPGVSTGLSQRYPLLCADTVLKRLIWIGPEGAYVYQVPEDDGNDGAWSALYTIDDWADTISGGTSDGGATWEGCVGTHVSALNKTFFRYNANGNFAANGKPFNRIDWVS